MLPACCTSSYRSIMEQPRRVSSLKNISSFLNSSNARMSEFTHHTPQSTIINNLVSFIKNWTNFLIQRKRVRKLTEFVVFVRGKPRSPKLGEHLSRVFQRVSEIVRILNNNSKEIGQKLGLEYANFLSYPPLCFLNKANRAQSSKSVYQGTVHIEGVLLEAGDPSCQPFLFVFDNFRDHSLSLSLSVFLSVCNSNVAFWLWLRGSNCPFNKTISGS